MDLDVHDAAAIRRRQRDVADAAGWLAVLALPVGEDDPVAAVRRAADDLEPAVGVRHVDERPVGQPAGAGVVAALASDDLARAGRDVDDRDLRRVERIGRRLGHRPRSGRRPATTPGVRRRCRWRSARPPAAAAGRAAAGRDAGPAHRSARPATSRGGATGRPDAARPATIAGRVRRRAWRTTLVSRDPSASTIQISSSADEGQPPAVGRPLRIADRLLGRGQLRRRRSGPSERSVNSCRAPATSAV